MHLGTYLIVCSGTILSQFLKILQILTCFHSSVTEKMKPFATQAAPGHWRNEREKWLCFVHASRSAQLFLVSCLT